MCGSEQWQDGVDTVNDVVQNRDQWQDGVDTVNDVVQNSGRMVWTL
jgi:hypothetical protein